MRASYTDNQYLVHTADQSLPVSKSNGFSMVSDRKTLVQSIKMPTEEVEYKQQKVLDDSPSNKSSTIHHRNLSHLEKDKQILIERMIRQEVLKQSKNKNRKMSLDTDETCICTSDIYTKEGSHWKNREISQITNKKFDSIPFENVKKLKVLSQQPMMGCNIFRITIDDKQIRDYAVKHIDISTWFGSSIWAGLAVSGLGSFVKRDFEGDIEGEVLKKSQFLGNWELRHISISAKKGLYSCKKKDGPASVQIKDAKQIWTRFQTIVHGEATYVIIKLWHMMFKYEFGIPVSDCVRWGKAFSTLIK